MAHALRRSMRPQNDGPQGHDGEVIKTLIESFRYPRKGPGMMWETAARRVKERGGVIHMGHALERLSYDGAARRWTATARRTDGSRAAFTATDVISSAPIRELCRALDPLPQCVTAADELRYRDFLTVALVVRKPDIFPDNWIYIHEPSVKVGRIQNFRSWSPEMMPDAGVTCLGLEYFCFEGDGLWAAADADLIVMATRELAAIGLAQPHEIADGCVVRQRKAYPVYDEHYRARVDTIRRELSDRYPTLHLVGRNGMHKYNNQDHAMMTAMLTCRNIVAGRNLYDVWAVNEDAEYHEAGGSGAVEALGSVRQVPERVGRVA
jgi:protoporphyrinogen oxidase